MHRHNYSPPLLGDELILPERSWSNERTTRANQGSPPEDRKAAAELLKPYFDEPQAKRPAIPTLISLEQFRCQYGHRKSPAWCRLYLLPKMPGVYGLNQGKGHPVKIDVEKATRWLTQYEEEIDWNRPLPR